MKIWTAHLSDGYGLSKFSLHKDRLSAMSDGMKILSEYNGGEEIDVIENYQEIEGRYLIITKRSAEEFFPGEAQVLVEEMEVK